MRAVRYNQQVRHAYGFQQQGLFFAAHHSSPSRENGQVAQLVERSPEKAGVGGSIPSLATI
jgi:hypothetical protein